MASRRIIANEKNILEKDDQNEITPAASGTTSVAPAVPASVIIKLLVFTVAMILGPLGAYFASLHTIYRGNSTWAGATAAIVANIVLIAYVIVAFRDDETERLETEERTRKQQ